MGKFTIKLMVVLCTITCSLGSAFAQGSSRTWSSGSYVKVNINSGNPAFPYPQFLEYKTGKTLAKYNAEGVTHADMEKTGREAYEIMSHRCRYDGGTHCGVPYITFNNFRKFGDKEMPQGGAEFCTEGDGYMMLAAAIFADQATFNGLWMWIHDNRIPNRVRYQDGKVRLPNYEFGGGLPICYAMEGSTEETHGSATDGDDDIAMALLIAYKQWGEFMMQDGKPVLDFNGKPISYKEAAEDFLKAFVDTFNYTKPNSDGTIYQGGHMSGNIGVDGYVKGGNKGKEVSSWRNTQTTYPDISQFSNISGGGGDGNTHTDYCAPAYYNEFAKWFESGDVEANDWQIGQYKRAEASSDWLCGEAYKQGLVSSLGTTNMQTDGKPTFTNFSEGEDFRTMWRMAQNYLWHGAPEYNWNPTTHQIEKGSNSNEYDMALRAAALMKEPPAMDGSGKWCGKLGASPDPGQPSFWGPAQIKMCYNTEGGVLSHYGANYALGCAAPAVVINEDLDLIADLYRQSELMWDDASGESSALTDDERYIESMPKYFHGWFRCLPLLTYTGNWHPASDMKSAANMKVYMSVDKTYAYVGDPIDYTVQYRNYGSADAKGVKIETEIDPNYEVVSIAKGGKFSGGKIVWNIGDVPGFKTGGLDATIDSVSFRVVARDTLNPRICLTSKITGSNFDEWVSNEYPNHATYTMERNCVDILANRTLMIKKKSNRTKLNPNDAVTFTVEFSNSSEGGEASWMNGGRDHVNLSYGNTIMEPYGFRQFYRFWNDAHEAYIDLGNYRMSYFMNDGAAMGLYDEKDNPTGWTFQLDNGNDMTKYGWMPNGATTKFTYQKLPPGTDEKTGGKWNQRIMIQFPKTLMATTTHVYDKLDSKYLLHKGGWGPCFFRTVLKTNPAQQVTERVKDDWSYDPKLEINNLDGQAQIYTLVSPNFADYNNLGYDVTVHSRYACDPLENDNYDRVLVEEFDGYTWRRIIGRGPLPGREAYDVTVIDTIPYELEWVCWKDSTALKDDKGEKIKATYTPAANPKSAGYTGIVKWTIPTMLVGEQDKLVYMCKARDLGCPDVDDTYYMNVAWISSKTDSPDSSRVELMTTCTELPPQAEPQDALFKKASKKKVMIGDDISYTLTFKNTLGSTTDVDCKSTNGLIKLGNGILPEIGTKGYKLQTKGDGTPFFFAHDHCYGADGEVFFTIEDGSNNQETYIVFRYEGGTPGKADFKGVAMKIMVNKDGKNFFGFYLYDNGTQIDAQGTTWEDSPITFLGSSTEVKFKFVLKGEKIFMYINDEEDEWTNPRKDWTVSAKGPGYFGAYVNSNGNASCQMSQFLTNLDYAFDITIGDALPAELSDITNISDKGTYDASKHMITWPTFATTAKDAMAPGDSVVYTFDATVDACEKFVNNYGWATVYGLDSLKVLNTIECGEVECDLTDIVAKLSLEEICDGDSTYIKAVATPKSKNYTYEFFSGKTSLNETPIKVDSFLVKEAGSYSVTVYNEEIPGCKLSSDPVKLIVNPLPEEVLKNGVALCDGEGLDLSKATIDGYDLTWYSDDVAAFEVTNLNIDGSDVLGAYFYKVTDKTTKCTGKIQTMEVSKEAIPAVPTVTSPKEFAVGAGKEDITKLATSEDGRVVWYESETSTDSLRTPITVSVATEDTITYYVSAVSKGGCESERDKVVVYITSSNKPKVSDTTLCIGETIDIVSLVEPLEAGQTLIWCDASGASLSEPTPFKSTTPGETKYYVKSTNGTAESEIATITITTVGVGTAVTSPVTYCEDENAAKLVATTDASSLNDFVKADNASKFEWYLGGVKLGDDALIPSTSKVSATTTNTYKVVPTYTIAKDHVCKGDTAKLDVTITHVDAPAVNNVITYTFADTLSDGTFKKLLSQDASAVTAGTDMTLVWYDENMIELPAEPIPSANKNDNKDVTLTYFVSQKDSKGCESMASEVDVIISLTPVPKTKIARFCEDVMASGSIEDYVEKTDPSYSLKWYDADKSKGGVEISTPTISTSKTTAQPTDTVVYYVCQVDGTAESSTVPVKVIIYARPQLRTHFDTVCSRAVNLDTMWVVSNDVSNVYSSFTDEHGDPLDNPSAIDSTGKYKVMGYFIMPNTTNERCYSDTPEEIYVEIHKFKSLSIDGPSTACPRSSVELDAVLKGDTYTSDITYTWNKTNNSTSSATGNFVSDVLLEPTMFEVTVSDGFCTAKEKITVNIGDGEVKGTIIFTEDSNTEAIVAHGNPITFYSCGNNYTLTSDLVSDDNVFYWSNGEVGKTISLSNEGTYVVSYTNKCVASQKVIVINAGINNNTLGKDTILCEGAKYEMALDFSCGQPTTIEWEKDGVGAGTSNKISIASASTSHSGLYTYTIKNESCSVNAIYGTLSVSEAPSFNKIVDDTTICDGSTVTIGLSSLTPTTAKMEWDVDPTLISTGLEAVVTPTISTTYRFTVSQQGGCEVKDSVTVEVEEPILFTATPTDTIICMTSGTIRLSTNVSQGRPRKYSWMNEDGDVLSTSPIYKAPLDMIGEHVYVVSVSNGVCEPVTSTSVITIVGYPEISAVDQKGYRDVEIIPSQNNETSNFMFKVDDSEYQKSTRFTDLRYGSHTAYIVDEYGCKSDYLFTTETPEVEFPSVVTPNGDGVNDAFISEVIAEAYPDAVVTIFDRFGKKLTEIKGSDSWDGTYLGHKMPSTDYWYEIWIEEIRKKYVGHFTLIND